MSDAERYRIPAATHRVDDEIQRSRFITTVGYAPSVVAARAFIAEVSAIYANASHNCWAHVVGAPGSTAQVGMSDAGEPHGTAGRPMLNVLLHSEVGDICAVVTRYFGGTLLGKGGLVRAYSGGVALALASLPTIERVTKGMLLLVVDYAAISPLRRLLAEYEAVLMDKAYAADVTCRIELPAARINDFSAAVTEMTSGQALIEIL